MSADGERVAVALFPVDYAIVEVVTDAGEEILQQDFSEAQLFMHSIQELEKARMEKIKTKKRKIAGSEESSDEKKPKIKEEESELMEAGDDVIMKEEPLETPNESVQVDGIVKTEPVDGVNGVESVENGHTHENGGAVVKDEGTEEEHHDEADEEEVIDPRIHYRPMVAELQASIIELNQLINTIDLIRRREFLEDMQCIRENTMEKKDELEYLIESKAQQLKESSQILLAGVDALTSTVEKESNFFDGVTEMIRKWKICAPIHGNIPKPFRAGEPLAVDCSFVSAGSNFAPPTRSIADLSFAELSRTEKGLVCIKTPEEYMARTIQVELKSLGSGATGSYRLLPLKMINIPKVTLDRLENTPDDLKILDERNVSVLKAVQFSVFCEELFYTVMQEALWSSGSWSDSALSSKKPLAKKPQRGEEAGGQGPSNVSVIEILDDEIRLRLRDCYEMTIRLLDARVAEEQIDDSINTKPFLAGPLNGHRDNGAPRRPHRPHNEDDFLRQTCRFAMLSLQQEVRQRHGRRDISRGLLFLSNDAPNSSNGGSQQNQQSDAEKYENGCVLAAVVSTISHNLLKNEVAEYLDDLSANLAWQNMQCSSTGRIMEDGLNQPICDSVRGVYVSPRWKSCPYDATLAAFDLNIGKCFSTEVVISGTKIRFEDGPSTIREVTSLAGLQRFVEKTVCSQIAQTLHRDFASFGFKQSNVDLDRSSVRLLVSGDWDGNCIGDGRVPDTKPTSCIFFEPYFTLNKTITIKCVLQAVKTSSLSAVGSPIKNGKGEPLFEVDWLRIPGNSDVAKVVWLLQNTTGLPEYFSPPEVVSSKD